MRKVNKIIKFLKNRYRKRTAAVHRRSDNPFKVLISCVLSQRTTDINTERASKQLFKVAKTPKQILKLPNKKLEKLIRPSGFYRQKAKKIKQISKVLLEKYKGKVPDTREELLKLPGVGYKTSAVTMSYCFNSKIIPVDIHVQVVSKRLGLVPEDADVEEVRKKLEKIIPEKDRYRLHLDMIFFGKEVCRTRNPKCNICDLSKLCKYYKNIYTSKSRVKV